MNMKDFGLKLRISDFSPNSFFFKQSGLGASLNLFAFFGREGEKASGGSE
ncbi:hypothetical protein [Anaerocolumna xylanovorans]|uniref:Uncharacterized protein n=1 Tax=Anaerocolumna xylanovorans DSM 12503 TaxID=1121345 RepID=A0A1M7YHN3_9FIRM|nr:hypothetical protein [Anaerocolumna xylanovorans]SHO52142.1 hypothetical protein SAMN02745217_03531 [Anaerocolumna xylanovorans DSM 12503]